MAGEVHQGFLIGADSVPKRTFWTKLNHDDARMAIEMMDDAEVGRWFRGWLAGAGGNDYSPEKVGSWPVEMRTGFGAGRASFAEAEIYSEKQRERVSKRYRGSTTVDHGTTTETPGSENPTEHLPSNSQQPTARIEKEQQHIPLTPQRGKRVEVSPGMFDEMIPEDLALSPEFVESWHRWVHVRKDRKKPITPHAAGEQLKTLAGFGIAEAIASIRQSIANDWQGLFPPKSPPRPSGPQGKAPVKWTGFDQTNYDQAKDQCRKDERGNFLL